MGADEKKLGQAITEAVAIFSTEKREFILYRTAGGAFFEYDAETETIALLIRDAVRAIMREPDAANLAEFFGVSIDELWR